ncbi:MAG: hypothetical protein M3179_01420 [Actinomycetota bacterium]|nr:hypothetical protein [Actinomycetota bacterium]
MARVSVSLAVSQLEEVAGRARPVALAEERLLPVLASLEPLLPQGLRRGTVVTVSGATGSTSLALALAAAASRAGSWCAAVVTEPPPLGLQAAAQLGIVLERFPVVVVPSSAVRGFAWVLATLIEAFDVVLAWPLAPLRPADARRLVARGRERGSTLVVAGSHWPESADLRLEVGGTAWQGIGRGHGRLERRQLEVRAVGRGAASRERSVRVCL